MFNNTTGHIANDSPKRIKCSKEHTALGIISQGVEIARPAANFIWLVLVHGAVTSNSYNQQTDHNTRQFLVAK